MEIHQTPRELPKITEEEEHAVLFAPEGTTGITHAGTYYHCIDGVVRVPLDMVEELVKDHGFKRADAQPDPTNYGEPA